MESRPAMHPRPSTPANRGRPRRLLGAAFLALCFATLTIAALTTPAQGEPSCHHFRVGLGGQSGLGESGILGHGAGEEQRCREANELIAGEHTSQTYWTQIAGAPHPEDEPFSEDSPTPVTVDLFAVRQRNSRQALAGGAACKEEVAPEELESCERVPVIYATDEDSPWHEDYRFPDDKPGYVGAIAWIGKGKALAVGGSGTYPRREPPPPDGSSYAQMSPQERIAHDRAKGAGDARAWVLRDETWTEITDSLPEEMGGLSALDIWIGREEDGDEWGLAGDYGHIWEWEGGRFTESHIDNESESIGAPDPEWAVVDGPLSHTGGCDLNNNCNWFPTFETSSPDFFDYRVRGIRIAPIRAEKRAIAFTAGCCGAQAEGGSRQIDYVEAPRKGDTGVHPDDAPPPAQRPRWRVHDDHPDADADYGESVYSFALRPDRHFAGGGGGTDVHGEPDREYGALVFGLGERVVATAGEQTDSETAPRYVASDGDTGRPPIRLPAVRR